MEHSGKPRCGSCYNSQSVCAENMKDLANPFWIKAKGVLFLFLGLLAATLLLLERPAPHFFGLLLLVVWSFCRFYYFAFYVMSGM